MTVAVKIKDTSIIDMKQKISRLQDIQDATTTRMPFQNVKGLKEIFMYKNVIPVPHALVKSFLELNSHDPTSVAQAFFDTINNNHWQEVPQLESENMSTPSNYSNDYESSKEDNNERMSMNDDSVTPITRPSHTASPPDNDQNQSELSTWLQEFSHVLQFCYLCSMGKIEPIIYTIQTSQDIIDWKQLAESTYLSKTNPMNNNP